MHRECSPGFMGVAVCVLLALAYPALAQESPLNDTGLVDCYNASAMTGTVTTATPDPETSGFNAQDCTRGSAAADALGRMVKIGASATPGRDYTKIGNDGDELGASAVLGSDPADWACTRDNRTDLVWEVKLDDATNLRHYTHLYAWQDDDDATNGGESGDVGGDSCHGTLPGGLCNTEALRAAINAAGLCGANDWRLPTATELQSLVDYGAGSPPYIDTDYFPNTGMTTYWSGSTHAGTPTWAWNVYFGTGERNPGRKSHAHALRLVRGSP